MEIANIAFVVNGVDLFHQLILPFSLFRVGFSKCEIPFGRRYLVGYVTAFKVLNK